MRVLHLADPHIFLTGPRAEECRRIIDWIAANAREAKPDAIVIAGDVYERRSTPPERLYLAAFLQTLADVAPVYVVSGNHDDREDLRLFQKEYGFLTRTELFLEPGIWPGPGGLRLAMLPWPDLGSFSAKAEAGSIVMRRELEHAALVDVLRGFAAEIQETPDAPSLLIAHISAVGASMDSGQPVSGGEDLALSAEELLESGCSGVALGHIHLRQQMKTADSRPVWYAGAPFRGSFGEAKGTKGGLIWDWDGKTWQVTPWEIPARSMVLIEKAFILTDDGQLATAGGTMFDETIVKDADVRVRITFPAETREAMRAAIAPELEALRAVAHAVTVEERASIISRTRCAEITAARTTLEKLQAWAQAVGAEVPAGAEAKLHALEAEITS